VTLCISILLSLTVFILLLAKKIPPTSDEVPLMGRYLLFTLVVNTMSIALTIIVINVHFRNPSTHKMSPWVRKLFLTHLPKLLMIERPSSVEDLHSINGASQYTTTSRQSDRNTQNVYLLQEGEGFASPRSQKKLGLSPEVRSAVRGVNFIVEHAREANNFKTTVRDWKYVALVLDRLFLWIFAIVCIVGTGAIVLNAPPLYETDEPIPRVCSNPEKELNNWFCIFTAEEE
ncbi:putative Acetylcholine receptor subunit beta-like 2, partial [Hypsibius exemplaris]